MDRRERERAIGVVVWTLGLCGGVVWVPAVAYECTVALGNRFFNGVTSGSSLNVVLWDKDDLPCSGVGVPSRAGDSPDAGKDWRGRANGLSGIVAIGMHYADGSK